MSVLWGSVEAAGIALLALLLAWLRKLLRDSSPQSTSPKVWSVKVVSATSYNTDYLGRPYTKQIEGEVSVRLVRGKEMHPIGTIEVGATDFEQELQALIAKAEERASTLNAYGDGLL